jgi:hypothetical protein
MMNPALMGGGRFGGPSLPVQPRPPVFNPEPPVANPISPVMPRGPVAPVANPISPVLGRFHKGGKVPKTGAYLLKKGEHVIAKGHRKKVDHAPEKMASVERLRG